MRKETNDVMTIVRKNLNFDNEVTEILIAQNLLPR